MARYVPEAISCWARYKSAKRAHASPFDQISIEDLKYLDDRWESRASVALIE